MKIPAELKPAAWGAVGGAIALAIIGFTWGGWVTGGTADEMATDARESGRAELAAAICVDRFLDETTVAAKLAELKDKSKWQRGDYIEDGGWATPIGFEKPVEGAADLCATQLAEMEAPVQSDTAQDDTATAGTGTSVN